ncbi:MAG: orotidine 5'-phosphate decarboxylase [Peptococcaceae bacterium BRH_c4b]|nr:MAG: orotidine 5'-phosphate decarboxylase [Peptococcaceae bacterium BRH_c4b]
MSGKDRLIIALDVSDSQQALDLVKMLAPYAGMFKVGMELFYSQGAGIISEIKKKNGKVFLDLKLHDIPNTVYRAARALAGLGADIINVHAAGGKEMMRQAMAGVKEGAAASGARPPLVIAVTVLTSIDQEVFNNQLGVPGPIIDIVLSWAVQAKEAGLDGVVASPLEVAAIREACGKNFVVVTPGIRPSGSDVGDQKRIMTPGQAINAGATYIVVGRPVTAADDPVSAAMKIAAEIDLTPGKGCVG